MRRKRANDNGTVGAYHSGSKQAFTGKDEIIRKVLMTIYAGGHVLLEDNPGMGKTTLALAIFKSTETSISKNPVYNRYASVGYYRIYDVQPTDK